MITGLYEQIVTRMLGERLSEDGKPVAFAQLTLQNRKGYRLTIKKMFRQIETSSLLVRGLKVTLSCL